jgi:protein-disulfide isomerase
VVYLNLIVHEPARAGHLASCAAARQAKYREFKRAFWDKAFTPYAASQGKDPALLGEANILVIARGLGLDTAKLKLDMASPACAARIAADTAELAKFHVTGTPTFFINGKHVGGGLAKAGFVQLIDEQLQLVASSGVPGAEYYKKVVLAKGEKAFRSQRDPKPN